MYRLIFSLLSILPWWAYAAIAVALGSATFNLWNGHQASVLAAERAVLAGPPPVQKLDDLDARLRTETFAEMHVAGLVRADLGVGRLDGATPKTFIVLDGANASGPVLAVLFVGTDNQAGLSDLIATADPSGLVVASGFRRTLDRAEVAGQLRIKGIRREVVLMEAMVGNRADVLRARGGRDLPFVILVGGLAALSAFVAYWRYPGRAGRPSRQGRRAVPATPPPPQAPKDAVSQSPRYEPWGAKPAPSRASAATGTAAKASRRPQADAAPPVLPEFKSVFPGGAGQFRFKTADQIIRETFGTVTTLGSPKSKD